MEEEAQEVLRGSLPWEWVAAIGSVLVLALLTWLTARWLARRLRGKTRFGLHGLERLAAPLTMAVGVGASLLFLAASIHDPPLIGTLLELVAIFTVFWLASRTLDVVWETGRRSARLRNQPIAGSVLLAGRHVGKLVLGAAALAMLAVRLGGGEQLYVVLAALAAAFAFAARDPIRNAVAFASMVLDPPFRLGDRVRFSDFRSGQDTVGEVIDVSLSGTTVRTDDHTLVFIANVMVGQLRVENLSAADRRRLELEVPVEGLSTEELREACAAIEQDLNDSPYSARGRASRVWIAGQLEHGLRLKAAMWLRREADRRQAQTELLLQLRARVCPHAPREQRPSAAPLETALPG